MLLISIWIKAHLLSVNQLSATNYFRLAKRLLSYWRILDFCIDEWTASFRQSGSVWERLTMTETNWSLLSKVLSSLPDNSIWGSRNSGPHCQKHSLAFRLSIITLDAFEIWSWFNFFGWLARIVFHALLKGGSCLDLVCLGLEVRFDGVVVADEELFVAWARYVLFLSWFIWWVYVIIIAIFGETSFPGVRESVWRHRNVLFFFFFRFYGCGRPSCHFLCRIFVFDSQWDIAFV